jgi:hypothetical protein
MYPILFCNFIKKRSKLQLEYCAKEESVLPPCLCLLERGCPMYYNAHVGIYSTYSDRPTLPDGLPPAPPQDRAL